MMKSCNDRKINVTKIKEREMSWGVPYGIYKDLKNCFYCDVADGSNEVEKICQCDDDNKGIRLCMEYFEWYDNFVCYDDEK